MLRNLAFSTPDYYGFLSGLSAGRGFMPEDFTASDWEVSGDPRGRWTHLVVDGRLQLGEGALERLERVEAATYWGHLAHNLGVAPSEIDRIRAQLETGPIKRRRSARRSNADRRVRTAIARSRTVLRALRAAREAGDPERRLSRLVDALYVASPRRRNTFDAVFMATLLESAGIDELADRGELLMRGRVTRTFDDENNLPERRDIVGRLGRGKRFKRAEYEFFPSSAVDLYTMLDWVRESE